MNSVHGNCLLHLTEGFDQDLCWESHLLEEMGTEKVYCSMDSQEVLRQVQS
jgi:hypothetical protein